MTEKNIDHLISMLPLIIMACYFYFLSRVDNPPNATKTPPQQQATIRQILIGIIISVTAGLIVWRLTK